MFCIDLNCFSVSGSSAARTSTVSATIDQPQLKPTVSWKKRRIASKKAIRGERTSLIRPVSVTSRGGGAR